MTLFDDLVEAFLHRARDKAAAMGFFIALAIGP
jgi:hypothetical protein